jgi:hypothetical protein
MIFLTILGLCIFEIVSSLDNAVVNAEVLATMNKKSRKWFLFWGILSSVFLVRGLLPWMIVWLASPGVGFFQAFTATLGNDGVAAAAVEKAAPLLLCGGGVFMLFLFLHWLFREEKHFGLPGEKFLSTLGVWYYTLASALLMFIAWEGLKINPLLAFSATVGSTAFFISHGFKEYAEAAEQKLGNSIKSDLSKILFLEVIDLCFSIDSVIGAFGFTLSVMLILIGNGLGALVVRQLTISNVDRIKDYPLLKNGAMYAIGLLSVVMILEAFGFHVPAWVTPIATIGVIAYFLWASFRKKWEAIS